MRTPTFLPSLLVCAAALAGGCAPNEPEPEPLPGACPDSVPGEVHLLAEGFGGTEGIAFSPQGRLFAGDGDVLTEVQPDGTWAVEADVPGIIGLAWWGSAATSTSP